MLRISVERGSIVATEDNLGFRKIMTDFELDRLLEDVAVAIGSRSARLGLWAPKSDVREPI